MAKDKKPDVVRVPAQSVLVKLLNKQRSIKADMDEAKGEIGQAIADAVDKHNLHPGAFKMVAKLQRMDAVKLMAFLTHFDDYRTKLELDKLAAPDLPGMGDGGAGDDDSEKEPEPETEPGHQKPPMFDDGEKAPVH